jgi:hypothetical protein
MFTPQLADYDGDGRLDLLSGSDCCQGGCFYVFRRQKDGGFAPRQQVNLVFPPEQLGVPGSYGENLQSRIAVADLNGDGRLDVLIGGSNEKFFGVVYGPLSDKGPMTVQRLWPKDQAPFPSHAVLSTNPVLADWDGDRLPDLILGAGDWSSKDGWRWHGLYWCRNVGTKQAAKFGPPQLLVADENGQTTGICVADWNGDGRPDLIASRMGYEEASTRRRHHKVWVYLRRSR